MFSACIRSHFQKVLKFLQIKDGGPNFWVEPILQKLWNIWAPVLYFNFKSFRYSISLSFIRFQRILHDSGVIFSKSWNICKLRGGGGARISEGNQFCRNSELFNPAFCISILKDLWTQIPHHSLDSNVFCKNQQSFSESFKISTN